MHEVSEGAGGNGGVPPAGRARRNVFTRLNTICPETIVYMFSRGAIPPLPPGRGERCGHFACRTESFQEARGTVAATLPVGTEGCWMSQLEVVAPRIRCHRHQAPCALWTRATRMSEGLRCSRGSRGHGLGYCSAVTVGDCCCALSMSQMTGSLCTVVRAVDVLGRGVCNAHAS